jgi:hypothetical protein
VSQTPHSLFIHVPISFSRADFSCLTSFRTGRGQPRLLSGKWSLNNVTPATPPPPERMMMRRQRLHGRRTNRGAAVLAGRDTAQPAVFGFGARAGAQVGGAGSGRTCVYGWSSALTATARFHRARALLLPASVPSSGLAASDARCSPRASCTSTVSPAILPRRTASRPDGGGRCQTRVSASTVQ